MVNPKLIDSLIRLIAMKRRISGYSLDIQTDLDTNHSAIISDMDMFQDKQHHTRITDSITTLTSALTTYNTSINDLLVYINNTIRNLEVKVVQDNYRNYESFQTTVEDRINIRSAFSDNLNNFIYGLKNSTDNWQFAGADLWPTDAKFTRQIVANDPVYIIADTKLVEIVSKEFNDFYAQRRLRKYENLVDLPNNSLGVAYCFGKYENIPLDPIKEEIKILFDKMLPGGVFYFTYNNCEYVPSLEFCNNYRAYQTEELITTLFYSVGFDKMDNKVFDDGAHNIMIVKKPGELKSTKQNAPVVSIVKRILNPEQIAWIESHKHSGYHQWYDNCNFSDDYPGKFDVDKQMIIEYIQWNIDSVTE